MTAQMSKKFVVRMRAGENDKVVPAARGPVRVSPMTISGGAPGVTRRSVADTACTYAPSNISLRKQDHTYQTQLLGPFYVPVYRLVGGRTGPEGNPTEAAAQEFARTRDCWSWWQWFD